MLSDKHKNHVFTVRNNRLNPCSNGICSLTSYTKDANAKRVKGLNPCSNGICSLTKPRPVYAMLATPVLILVLMEYAL